MYREAGSGKRIRTAAYIRMRKGKRIPSPEGEGRVRGRHGGETDRQTETRPGETHGFRTFKMPQVGLCHTPRNPPEPKSAEDFF
jgi:hypothetical protein